MADIQSTRLDAVCLKHCYIVTPMDYEPRITNYNLQFKKQKLRIKM